MNIIQFSICFGVFIAAATVQAVAQEKPVSTLYRNSFIDSTMRIHIATFDADVTIPTYNSENCQIAAKLFQGQSGVSVRYWCEPGRYRQDW